MNDQTQVEIEAQAFRRLLAHLDEHKAVQNIDLMNLAGFCRNCLSKWYMAAAEAEGVPVDYDQARLGAQNLTRFYRNLSGSFRGLDARIPREMDQKGREALETMAQANLRLAAVFRRQNQPEVAVPLLVEVVKVMTPANPEGRKAYQNLVEIGFAASPYTAGDAAAPGK